MRRATLRNLLAHKLRLALSALAIVLGVGFVSGTLIFTDTLSKTFNDLFGATAADVTVEAAAAFDVDITEGSGARATVPASVVDTIREVDGVDAVQGFVDGEGVYVLQKDGEVLGTGGAPGVGLSWDEVQSLSSNTLTSGRAPEREGEIALDEDAVERSGYAVGDTVPVLTPGPRIEAELVGVFRFGEGGSAGATLTAFDLATAQELLTEPGQFSGVAVGAAEGVTDDELRERVAGALGTDYQVRTAQEQADELSSELAEGLQFINVFLLVFAGVALFVGSFIILNTFSMLVAQRTKELALLRALGASRGQVTRSVLVEALVLGVVGSTIGLLGGLGIASALRALFGSFGLTLDGSLVFAARTVVWAYVVGILVTLFAAYLPARRAARTAAVAAVRDEVSVPSTSLRRRTVLGGVLGLLAVAGLVVGGTSDDGSQGASLIGLGALLLVLAAIALSPILAQPFLRTVGAILPKVWGRTGHLARENAMRNPRRTAATASALMVGLALVSGFSILGTSTNASLDKLIDDALGADYVVSSAVGQPFTPEVAERLGDVEGVEGVMQERFGSAQVDGESTFVSAVDPDALDASLRLEYVEGSTQALTDDAVLVDSATAQTKGWAVGTELEVLLPNGEQLALTVGGVFEPNQAIGSTVVTIEAYEAAGGPALDNYVYVNVAEDADGAAVRSELEETVSAYPVVSLKDQTEFADEQKGQIDQLLIVINALLVLSVLIAALGIVNTLALSVIERTREIGLLRAVGMGRAQLRRMVRLESVIISIYGATMGLVLGTVFGVTLTRALRDQGIEVLSVPVGRLLLFLAIAALIGVLAAVWPARRAAKLKVLDAIATA